MGGLIYPCCVIIELMSQRPKRKKSYIFYIASLSVILVSSLINFHLWWINKNQKKTIEKQLEDIFNQKGVDRLEFRMGVLRRVKEGEQIKWIIEI